MSDDIGDIRDYYDARVAEEDERLARHQLEAEITLRYLEAYLPSEGRVLEIGAATGYYTRWMAERGYAVTAADLSENELTLSRERLAQAGLDSRVAFLPVDARDLSALSGDRFDAVLMMGPLYHLVVEADRRLALEQAYARLVPGGIFFSTHISRFGIMGDLIKNIPEWIVEHDELRAIIERGRDPEDYPRGRFRGYFTTLAEIAPLHEAAGFQTLVVAGIEPGISADDESYNRLEGELRRLWFDLLFELSREATLIASSRHILYIGQKLYE
jgi:SAM-dependent methyltransferase